MNKRQKMFVIALAMFCAAHLANGNEIRVLRDERGRKIGTIEETKSSIVMRDASGKLVWWHHENPPVINPVLDLRPVEKSESNLLIEILKLPAITAGVILGLSIALIKVVIS